MNISLEQKLDDLGINLSSLETATIETLQKAVAGVAKAAQSEWIRMAQSRLKTSRMDYIDGLRKAESFGVKIIGATTVFEITLIGRMPNNFEFGMDSFDMKASRPGWLGGGKAKEAKDGHKYITIPFRHSLSSAARLAYSGKAARADMKRELKKTVRKFGLDRMVRSATGKVVAGPVSRVPVGGGTHRYLDGLTRIQQPVKGERGQSQLLTWRVMSENSPEGSWIHPGIKGAKILPEVERWAENELERVISMITEAV